MVWQGPCIPHLASANGLWQLALGAVGLVAVLIVGGVAVQWVRRRFHPSGRRQDGSLSGGFSMESLDAMRRQGALSEEEFRTLRRAALGLRAGPAGTEKSASSAPPPRDDDTGGTARPEGPCAE